MPAETLVSMTCDAPHCGRVLEGGDGSTLFASLEIALQVADEADWLVTRAASGGERKTYCRTHWHWTFGVRSPYWGAPRRRWR